MLAITQIWLYFLGVHGYTIQKPEIQISTDAIPVQLTKASLPEALQSMEFQCQCYWVPNPLLILKKRLIWSVILPLPQLPLPVVRHTLSRLPLLPVSQSQSLLSRIVLRERALSRKRTNRHLSSLLSLSLFLKDNVLWPNYYLSLSLSPYLLYNCSCVILF